MDVMMEMRRLAVWRNEKSMLWKWRFKGITQAHKGEQKNNQFILYQISHEEQAADILQHNNLNPKDFNGNKKMWLSRRTLERSPSFFLFFCFPWPFLSSQLPSPRAAHLSGYLPSFSSHHLPPPPCSCISQHGFSTINSMASLLFCCPRPIQLSSSRKKGPPPYFKKICSIQN